MADYTHLVLSAVNMGAIHQLKQGTIFSFRHLSRNMNLYISNTIIIMNLDSCVICYHKEKTDRLKLENYNYPKLGLT